MSTITIYGAETCNPNGGEPDDGKDNKFSLIKCTADSNEGFIIDTECKID